MIKVYSHLQWDIYMLHCNQEELLHCESEPENTHEVVLSGEYCQAYRWSQFGGEEQKAELDNNIVMEDILFSLTPQQCHLWFVVLIQCVIFSFCSNRGLEHNKLKQPRSPHHHKQLQQLLHMLEMMLGFQCDVCLINRRLALLCK